jgi:predicted phage terminase large subunit-like protein
MYLTPYEIYRKLTVKDSIPAVHVKRISDTLIHVTLNDDYYNRLCVSQPPRTAKSSLITLSYPFWLILNNPDTNIVIVNNTQTLAENFGIRLRQLFIDYQEILALNNIRLSDTKHSNSFFMFETLDGKLYEGSIKLMGTGGTLTGQDVDILICDDLIKGFSDVTPTLLDKKIEWFKSIILQRLEPHSKLIVLGTRWASNDVIGYLQSTQPTDYKFINLTALNKDETDCIWNNRYDVKFFQDRREEMGERLFEALYQQKPLDTTGNYFNLDRIRFEENTRTNYTYTQTVRSWDLAYSDESKGQVNDSTASCLMTRTLDNQYIIHEITNEQYGDKLKNVLRSTAYIDTPNTPILIETGTTGGAAEFLFKEYRDNNLQGYNVQQSKPIGAKVDRAAPFRDAILDGKIIIDLPDHQREQLLRQLQGFPLGKHDDIIDAISYAYNYLSTRGNDIIKTSGYRKRERI